MAEVMHINKGIPSGEWNTALPLVSNATGGLRRFCRILRIVRRETDFIEKNHASTF